MSNAFFSLISDVDDILAGLSTRRSVRISLDRPVDQFVVTRLGAFLTITDASGRVLAQAPIDGEEAA